MSISHSCYMFILDHQGLYSKVFSLKDADRQSLHYKTSLGTMARKGRRANYAMALKGFLLKVTLITYIKFYWPKHNMPTSDFKGARKYSFTMCLEGRKSEILRNSNISFCPFCHQIFLHAKYTHLLPKTDKPKALVRAFSSKPRISEWCVVISTCTTDMSSFDLKTYNWKDKIYVPMDRITTVKILFWKETCNRDRCSSVAVLKFCWAAILKTFYHPGYWGIFLH